MVLGGFRSFHVLVLTSTINDFGAQLTHICVKLKFQRRCFYDLGACKLCTDFAVLERQLNAFASSNVSKVVISTILVCGNLINLFGR